MTPSEVCATEDGDDPFAISRLFYRLLFKTVHRNDLPYRHIRSGIDDSAVVDIIDVSTYGRREVEITPTVGVNTEELGVDHAVVPIGVLQTTGFVTRGSRIFEIRELKTVEFSTYVGLNLELRDDVIHDLSVHTEQVFV